MTGIIIAFPSLEAGEKIRAILVRNGFHVAGVCTSGAQAIQETNELDDGVVLCSYRLPDMMYRELKEYLPPGFRMVTVSSRNQWAENGEADEISLSLPLQTHELLSTMEMVVYNVRGARKKTKPKGKVRSPEEQELIERAKGILMSRNNMTEEEAHRYLQKTSMDNGTTFTETAQMILAMLDG